MNDKSNIIEEHQLKDITVE